MTACSEHSLKPAKQDRTTPRRACTKGSRDYLCQLSKPQTTASPPSEALACCSLQSRSKIFWHPDRCLWGPTHPFWSLPIPYRRLADPLPGQRQKPGHVCLQAGHPSVSPSPCSSDTGCSLPALAGLADTKSGVICRESHLRNGKLATLAFERGWKFRMYLAFQL